MPQLTQLPIELKLIGGLVFLTLFGWRFFKISKGTGLILYVGISMFIGVGLMVWFPVFSAIATVLVLGLIGYESIRGKSKQTYVGAQAVFEGGGIKRGLTPPEAALLLGKPVQESVALMLVSLLKKGFAEINVSDSIRISVVETFLTRDITLNPEKRSVIRKQKAQALNQVVYPYEEPLLELLEQETGKSISEIDFSILVKPFVEDLAFRVGGFDFEQTRKYYELIVRRAPKEARMEGKLITDYKKVYEKNVGWILLADDYGAIFGETNRVYQPPWLPKQVGVISDWYPKLLGELGDSNYIDSIGLKLGKEIDPEVAKLLSSAAQITYHN